MSRTRIVLPLRTWLALSHLVVLLLPVLVLVATGTLARELRMQTRGDLENQGALIALMAGHELDDMRRADPGATLADLSEPLSGFLYRAKLDTLSGIRITDVWGVVVATSGEGLGDDLSGEPEVVEALAGRTGVVIRPREPASQRAPLASKSRRARVRLFVARPIEVHGELVGTVLLSRTPREEVQAMYQALPRGLLLGAVLALVGTFGLALWSGYMFTRSLKVVAAGAHRISDGQLSGLDVLARPTSSHVSEVRALAAAVGTMATRLQERLDYISEFAGNVSHEFKTPLSTLRGTVELLADDEDMPAEQRARFLVNAAEDVDRMERLVTGLLALARAEQAVDHRRVDLAEVMAGVGQRYPEVQVSGDPGAVLGNRSQLEAVLANLVENARVHGGVGVRIQVVGWVEGERTGYDVIDDGAGISRANLARVFDRFFTTDRARGGAGLGLALVKAICTTHRGDVEVESRTGHTRFRVSLPLDRGEGG